MMNDSTNAGVAVQPTEYKEKQWWHNTIDSLS